MNDVLSSHDHHPNRAFVYGTLQVPQVLERVLGRVPEMLPAVLHHYQRGRVVGQSYPTIVASPYARVDGVVLFVGAEDWPRLDHYEGELYVRRGVTVTLADQQTCQAACYVLGSGYGHLFDPTPWSLEGFVERDLTTFLHDWD